VSVTPRAPRTYNYSPNKNNGQITSSVDAGTTPNETITYTYDALKRLIQADGLNWTENYVYDGFGNLTQMNPTGGAPTLSVSVALDQNNVPNNRITASGVSYDNNGNLTLGFGNIGPEYDAANRVSQVWMNGQPNTYYGYDPDNHRVYSGGTGHGADTIYLYGVDGKKLATYTTTFTGSYPLYKMQLNCQSNNVYFGGRLVSAEGNSVRTDRLDSVRSGGPGGLGYQAQYPYGVEYTTTANDREKYATYTRDSLTGFDYAVNRYYSSQWGRFLSPDPQSRSVDPGNPQTWNRYSYVENDPTNISDPTGLWPGKYCWWDYGGESIGDFETCFELDVPQSGPTGGSGSGPNPCDKITDSVGLQGLSYAKASQIWSDGNLATYSSPSSAATVAALATITWLGESNFGLTPVNNGNYSASGTLTSVDYGPFQINQHFQPNTNGAVWGTN